MRTSAIAALALASLAAAARASGRTDDLWDVSQGVVVTATSGVVPGSAIEDLFGADSAAVEPRTTIFRDGMPAGFVHFVEWRTAAPITVDGVTVFANDDFSANKARSFSEFRLYARNTGTGEFDLLHTYTAPRTPYGEFIVITAALAPVVAEEFRAEFVQAGTVSGGPRVRELDGPYPLVEDDGFLLPLKAKAKFNAGTPSKSKFTVAGLLEEGSVAASFGTPTTLDAGLLHLAGVTPARKGKGFALAQGGFTFSVTPSPLGSSRAKFKLGFTGDLTGKIEPDAPAALSYSDGTRTVTGTPQLEGGAYAIRGAGELLAPRASLVKAKARIAGGGDDAFSLVFAATASPIEPTAPFGARFEFGGTFAVTLAPEAFRRKGGSFVLASPVAGLTKFTVNTYTGLVTVAGKGVDLGPTADGANVIRVALSLGADKRAVTVRMVKTGTALRY